MEIILLILMPVLVLIQFTAYVLMVIVGVIFNAIFRSDKLTAEGKNSGEARPEKPQNPWTVFAYSLVATLILALLSGSLCYYVWETPKAFQTGFFVMGGLGIFSSITAATGEAPPM